MTYQYRPLSSPENIRLFLLQPGPLFKGPITGHLFEFSAKTSPRFEALSYVCGPDDAAKRRYDITIVQDGKPQVHKLLTNLYLALNHVRDPNSAIFWWIDAITINSSDPIERGGQVEMMATTFGNAKQVVSWIRPKVQQEFAGLEQLMGHECWTTVLSDESEVLSEVYIPKWKTLLAFMTNVYWTRRWIAQEVFLARRLLLRSEGLTLFPEEIVSVLDRVQTSVLGWRSKLKVPTKVRSLLRNIVSDKNGFRKFTTFETQPWEDDKHWEYDKLERVLKHFDGLKCKDPRDTIYAMLSIGRSNGLQANIKADYRITAIELYLRVEVLLSDLFGPLAPSIHDYLLEMDVDHEGLICSMPLWSSIPGELFECCDLTGYSIMSQCFDWRAWRTTNILPFIIGKMLIKNSEDDLFLPFESASFTNDPTFRSSRRLKPKFIRRNDEEARFSFVATTMNDKSEDDVWWIDSDKLNTAASVRLKRSCLICIRAAVKDLWFGNSWSGVFYKLNRRLVKDQEAPPYRMRIPRKQADGSVKAQVVEPQIYLVYDFVSAGQSEPRPVFGVEQPLTRQKELDAAIRRVSCASILCIEG